MGCNLLLDQVIQHEAMVFLDAMKTEEHQLALSKLLAQMKFGRLRPIDPKNKEIVNTTASFYNWSVIKGVNSWTLN